MKRRYTKRKWSRHAPVLLTMYMNLADYEEFQETGSACPPQNLLSFP